MPLNIIDFNNPNNCTVKTIVRLVFKINDYNKLWSFSCLSMYWKLNVLSAANELKGKKTLIYKCTRESSQKNCKCSKNTPIFCHVSWDKTWQKWSSSPTRPSSMDRRKQDNGHSQQVNRINRPSSISEINNPITLNYLIFFFYPCMGRPYLLFVKNIFCAKWNINR